MKESDIEVVLIDVMGNDLSVVNAARVSFSKVSEEFTDKDDKLIKYLAEHNHWSPFAHGFLSFRIKAPIFLARQLVKHQVGLSWNEESRRYIDSEPEFYFPEQWRERHENKKQGSHEDKFVERITDHLTVDQATEYCVEKCLELYNTLLDHNVAPEQARMILPQNMMVNWIWSGSFYAFARVCNLRLDSHAQLENRKVAEKFVMYLRSLFPVCTKYLIKERCNE